MTVARAPVACCLLSAAVIGGLTAPAPAVATRPPQALAATPVAATGIGYVLDQVDSRLADGLERVVRRVGGAALAAEQRLAVALVDLSDRRVRYAAVNGDHMMYAASLPKIGILLGAFDALADGAIGDSPWLRSELVDMIRVSDNGAASRVLYHVGFDNVAETLADAGLYDPHMGGGLWVGKAFGVNDYWRRDPIANLSHGATARQVARFFVLLQKGKLVSRTASAQMKSILGDPGIDHKFVRGLGNRRDHAIYRKSGTWRDYHADAALVEHGDEAYVAVALVQDADGERLLQRLIAALDDLVCAPPERVASRTRR